MFLGSFNPAILHPNWLANQNLIRKEEAQVALEQEQMVVTSEFTTYQADWLRVQAMHERIALSTTDATKFSPLRDVATGIVRLLEHTPITAAGLNYECHVSLPSEEQWHTVGNYFAPKTTWNKVLETPGMLSLTIQGRIKDSSSKYSNIKIENSSRFEHSVFIQVNNHYELKPTQNDFKHQPALQAADIVDNEWQAVLDYGTTLPKLLLNDSGAFNK